MVSSYRTKISAPLGAPYEGTHRTSSLVPGNLLTMTIASLFLSRAPRRCSTVRSFRSSPSWWNSDIGNDGEFDARELMRQHLHSIKVTIRERVTFRCDLAQAICYGLPLTFDLQQCMGALGSVPTNLLLTQSILDTALMKFIVAFLTYTFILLYSSPDPLNLFRTIPRFVSV